MLSNLLLVAGAGVLSMALRSFENSHLHRAGTIGIFFTSFLAGWLLAGSVWAGIGFASTWLLLPWVEILTRVRRLRIPARCQLAPRPPPASGDFPGFGELTEEVEEEGFEFVQDSGWEFGEYRHFYRIFYSEALRIQVAICLINQEGFCFYYVSLTSIEPAAEREFITWNYPFSYTMKIPPSSLVQRIEGEIPFGEMLTRHREHLSAFGLESGRMLPLNPEEIPALIDRNISRQISHNLKIGILAREADDSIRYTLRGMVFLWIQFLRDLVRLS